MLYFTRGELERSIYDLEKYFNLDCDGKTIRECIRELRKVCPKLHTHDYLIKFGENLIDKVYEKYGWTGLRVWFTLSQGGIFRNTMMEMKYAKLYSEICDFAEDYRVECGLELKLDVQLASFDLIQTYKNRFVIFDSDDLTDLYSIVKTIELSHFNPELVKQLSELIELQLLFLGDNYYSNFDLNDVEVIKELYTHIAEEMGDDDVYEGHQIFHSYDGYGNVIMDV